MNLSSRNIVLSGLGFAFVGAIVIACGTEDSSTFPPPGSSGSSGNPIFEDSGFGEAGPDPGIDVSKDPFPKWCGPDAGAKPTIITGTEECPDDKNLPGCGCNRVGDTAACWTGLRKDRNLGQCKDGTTTCRPKNETTNVWGPCEGQVLPKPGGKGAEACSCFSAGIWKLENTSPCMRQLGGEYWAHSTVQDYPAAGQVGYCTQTENAAPGELPNAPGKSWSRNTLKVDCSGTFHLCFKIRQGDYTNPQATDCVIGEVCVDAEYLEAGVEQSLPPLPLWTGGASADAKACAKKWEGDTPSDKSPGYGEMIVKGSTVWCNAIDDGSGNEFVFNRVQYCPRICRPTNPADQGGYQPTHPECVKCQLAGKGEF
jgi:hypothetical protein